MFSIGKGLSWLETLKPGTQTIATGLVVGALLALGAFFRGLVISAFRLYRLRGRTAPALMPLFDHSSHDYPFNQPPTRVTIQNTSDNDAFRLSMEPIDLDGGFVLATDGEEIPIRAKQSVDVELHQRTLNSSPIGALLQSVDIVHVVQSASAVYALKHHLVNAEAFISRSWPVRVTFYDSNGKQYKKTWKLVYDVSRRRVRLVTD